MSGEPEGACHGCSLPQFGCCGAEWDWCNECGEMHLSDWHTHWEQLHNELRQLDSKSAELQERGTEQ